MVTCGRTRPVDLRSGRALVTGAGVRLGRASAVALAREGVGVVVHYGHSQAEAEETARMVREAGAEVWMVAADLSDAEERRACFAKAVELAGAIDILVNNAAVFPHNRLTDIADTDVEEVLRINTLAPLDLMRSFAAQGREGVVVNYLDTRVLDYDREHAAYHLSKRMLFDLTRMAALEFAPRVRVNAVAPGLILPPPGENDDYLARLAEANPLKCYGRVEDVTDALLFLARSPFITGQVIYADGGRHMGGRVYG